MSVLSRRVELTSFLKSGIQIEFLRLSSSKELLSCHLVATTMYTGSLRLHECAKRMASACRCEKFSPHWPANRVSRL